MNNLDIPNLCRDEFCAVTGPHLQHGAPRRYMPPAQWRARQQHTWPAIPPGLIKHMPHINRRARVVTGRHHEVSPALGVGAWRCPFCGIIVTRGFGRWWDQ